MITPVHKQGSRSEIENYRPIQILSSLSKVFEKCVKEKLINYLEHKNFFAPNQFGFLKEKSTDSALFHHIKHITEKIEEENFGIGVYFDMAKVFDTVHLRKMIFKLKQIGIQGSLLNGLEHTWWKDRM